MIGEDRIELNNRFVEVFKILENRGEVVKNNRSGKGMGDFASKILGNKAYGHIIRAFLNPEDKRVIDYKHARTLCREYNVNESYMIDGIGTPFGIDLPERTTPLEQIEKSNILYTTVEAFAGASVEIGHQQESLTYFSFPDLHGANYVSFKIKGNSMEPVINNKDVIICKPIDGVREILDNEIYAIKSNGSVWVKYLQKVMDNRGRVNRLKLISANYLEHDPFFEDVNENTRVYKVIRRIETI